MLKRVCMIFSLPCDKNSLFTFEKTCSLQRANTLNWHSQEQYSVYASVRSILQHLIPVAYIYDRRFNMVNQVFE